MWLAPHRRFGHQELPRLMGGVIVRRRGFTSPLLRLIRLRRHLTAILLAPLRLAQYLMTAFQLSNVCCLVLSQSKEQLHKLFRLWSSFQSVLPGLPGSYAV